MSASNPPVAAPVGAVPKWSRVALIAVAWLFAAGAVVQIFLAGLSVFESPEYWVDHVETGRMLGFLAYLLPILAAIGRVGMPRFMQALVVALLFVAQQILANLDVGFIAALHALNAFLLLGGAVDVGRSTLGLVRASR